MLPPGAAGSGGAGGALGGADDRLDAEHEELTVFENEQLCGRLGDVKRHPAAEARARQDGGVFSVELIPDAELDRVVREDWDRLLGADLPSSGRNPAPSNRPHVTLAVRERLEPSAFAGLADLLPVPLDLGGVLLLGHKDRYVLTRQVIVSSALLEVHRVVAEIAGRPEPRYSNTGIDHWTPHITLARGLTAVRLATAMRLIKAPHVSGQATGARVWDAEARRVTTIR